MTTEKNWFDEKALEADEELVKLIEKECLIAAAQYVPTAKLQVELAKKLADAFEKIGHVELADKIRYDANKTVLWLKHTEKFLAEGN